MKRETAVLEYFPFEQGCPQDCAHCQFAISKQPEAQTPKLDQMAQETLVQIQAYLVRHKVVTQLSIGAVIEDLPIAEIAGLINTDLVLMDLTVFTKNKSLLEAEIKSLLATVAQLTKPLAFPPKLVVTLSDRTMDIDVSDAEQVKSFLIAVMTGLSVMAKTKQTINGVHLQLESNNLRPAKFEKVSLPTIMGVLEEIFVNNLGLSIEAEVIQNPELKYMKINLGEKGGFSFRYIKGLGQAPDPISHFGLEAMRENDMRISVYLKGVMIGHSTYAINDSRLWFSHEDFRETLDTAITKGDLSVLLTDQLENRLADKA